MLIRSTPKRVPLLAWLWVALVSLALAACGGGGGGNSTTSGGGGGGGGGSSGSSISVAMAGVAAYGAPLVGATIRVMDATGTVLGSSATNITSGQYSLSVTANTSRFPLLVQAAGVDMQGTPVVLHTVIPSTSALTNGQATVHITPLTNAVVAMLMGGDPRTRFATPASIDGATWSLLGNRSAMSAASTFLLTAINANLNAAKPTALNKATLDIFSDTNFRADKTGQDAVLDGVRVQFATDAYGNELLRLSNRLILTGNVEVTINLSTAKSGLSASTPAVANTAIDSVNKTTKILGLTATTTATAITRVADLSTLLSTINTTLVIPGVSAASFNPDGLVRPPIISASFTTHNGMNSDSLISELVAYGNAGYQLSPFQIVGCLEDPVPTSGCTKVKVAALLRMNSTGQIMGSFEQAVIWASNIGWTFVGNDKPVRMSVYPATWQAWTSTGTVSGSAGYGVQADLYTGYTQFVGSVRLGLPTPGSTARALYVASNTGLGALLFSPTETGDLIADETLAVTQTGPLSDSDVAAGAPYSLAVQYGVLQSGTIVSNQSYATRLTAGLTSDRSAARYPVPNNLSGVPLTVARFTGGFGLDWSTWAAANPNMRVLEVRAVITCTTTAPVKQVFSVAPLNGTALNVPAFSSVPGDAVQYTLWLIAADEQGRRYISKIIAS